VDLLKLDLSSPEFSLMLPQLIVFGLAMVLLLGDAFFPRRSHYTVLTGISLVPPVISGADTATTTALLGLHLVAATVMIPTLARSLRTWTH